MSVTLMGIPRPVAEVKHDGEHVHEGGEVDLAGGKKQVPVLAMGWIPSKLNISEASVLQEETRCYTVAPLIACDRQKRPALGRRPLGRVLVQEVRGQAIPSHDLEGVVEVGQPMEGLLPELGGPSERAKAVRVALAKPYLRLACP